MMLLKAMSKRTSSLELHSLFLQSFSSFVNLAEKIPFHTEMHLLRHFMHLLALLKQCALAIGIWKNAIIESKLSRASAEGSQILKIDPEAFSHFAIPLRQVILSWLLKQVQLWVHQRSEISLLVDVSMKLDTVWVFHLLLSYLIFIPHSPHYSLRSLPHRCTYVAGYGILENNFEVYK